MEKNVDYQINYGAVPVGATAAVRPDPNAPLYASVDGFVASLSSSECVFMAKRDGEPHVMTFQVLQAMDQCREFRTLDEHIARILTTIPNLGNQREGMQRVLESLIKRGLMIAEKDFITELANVAPRMQAPLRAIFIRACDRPAQLERLLISLTDYERRFRAGRHYVLLDDSVDEKNINRQRDLLREFARSTGCKVSHVGAGERRKLAERLQKALPQSRAILPHLFERGAEQRFGGGRGWNLALLLSAGARMALFDEDQRLPLRRFDNARDGLDPDPNGKSFARFYRNFDGAQGAGEEVIEDPFALHLEACGQSLGALSANDAFRLDRQALRGLNLSRLNLLSPEAHVISTLQGTYGASRTESGAWMYQLDAESRADFWRDRDSYLRNVESRNLWYGVPQARVSSAVFFSPFVFDNSLMLPCTNPLGRGEDGLFSVGTSFCHPDSVVMELPVSIGHVQESERTRSDKTMQAHTPRFNHFLCDFIQRQVPSHRAGDPGQRMHLLAEVLRDLASATERERVAHLREYLSFARADLIERLQQQLEGAKDAPVYWEADMRAIVQANGKALTTKSAPRLADWDDASSERDCADALSSELRQLADAYAVWPAMWQHAHDQGDKLLAGL